MRILLVLCLFLSGCATCDFEAHHSFMKRNNLQMICYTIHSPESDAGRFCLVYEDYKEPNE